MTKRSTRRQLQEVQAVESFRKIKDKFANEREYEVEERKLVPLNEKQKYYMKLIDEKEVIVATGLAGCTI